MTSNALPALSGRTGTKALVTAFIIVLAVMITGCRDGQSHGVMIQPDGQTAAVAALQHVNNNAATCWMRSKDATFKDFRLIPELDTQAGRPRLLLLKKQSQQGLPVMVVEAHGSPVTIETYGPLAQTSLGSRIHDDIRRWSNGSQSCTA